MSVNKALEDFIGFSEAHSMIISELFLCDKLQIFHFQPSESTLSIKPRYLIYTRFLSRCIPKEITKYSHKYIISFYCCSTRCNDDIKHSHEELAAVTYLCRSKQHHKVTPKVSISWAIVYSRPPLVGWC